MSGSVSTTAEITALLARMAELERLLEQARRITDYVAGQNARALQAWRGAEWHQAHFNQEEDCLTCAMAFTLGAEPAPQDGAT